PARVVGGLGAVTAHDRDELGPLGAPEPGAALDLGDVTDADDPPPDPLERCLRHPRNLARPHLTRLTRPPRTRPTRPPGHPRTRPTRPAPGEPTPPAKSTIRSEVERMHARSRRRSSTSAEPGGGQTWGLTQT